MKCVVSNNIALGETAIRFESNCHTDKLPLIKCALFRRQPINTESQSFALAMAILMTDYCGDYFEVSELAIGSDYADAVRRVLGKHVNLTPVSPMHRALATYDLDVACAPVNMSSGLSALTTEESPVSLSTVTWSSDFVDRETRHSRNSQIGTYFTNATLLTDPTSLSVCVALIHAEDHAGRIYIPRPADGIEKRHVVLAEALQSVAISLLYVG